MLQDIVVYNKNNLKSITNSSFVGRIRGHVESRSGVAVGVVMCVRV